MKTNEVLVRSHTEDSVAAVGPAGSAESIEPANLDIVLDVLDSHREQSPTRYLLVRYLLTSVPLTARQETRNAMNVDWESEDIYFNQFAAEVCHKLEAVAGGENQNPRCVPLQGLGSFAVEAAIYTSVPRGGTVIVLAKEVYGQRLATMAKMAGRNMVTNETIPDTSPVPADIVPLFACPKTN